MNDAPVITIRGLGKRYAGGFTALHDINLDIRRGEIFALLGPNGAGKTTLISIVCGLVSPGDGTVQVDGHDIVREPAEAKATLGLVPQELALYEDLSARANLSFWGAAYGLRGAALRERVGRVLDLVGLIDRADEPVKRFSGGMKRRLNFGCGIVHRPGVLLLDEPTVGVDPQSRVRLLDLVRTQAREGACVLYTTHYMEEAQELCDRLAIIDHGQLLAAGTLDELRALLGERDLLRLTGEFEAQRAGGVLDSIEGIELVTAEPGLLVLAVAEGSRRLPAILSALQEAGAQIHESTLTRPSLESLFIKLTGRELRE